MTPATFKSVIEACPKCEGIGSVCLACDQPINDCECFEDQEPCVCAKCRGIGTAGFPEDGDSA